MIGTRQLRPNFLRALLCAVALGVVLPGHAARPAKPPVEAAAEANAFLDRFIGHWTGEGKDARGAPLGDDLQCERVLDGTFLFMRDAAVGASFKADTYVGYHAEAKRYELYTFNNNAAMAPGLPVRMMTGRRDGNRLVMEEKPGPKSLRYTFEFLDKDTFRLTKAFLAGSGPPIVVETFRRK